MHVAPNHLVPKVGPLWETLESGSYKWDLLDLFVHLGGSIQLYRCHSIARAVRAGLLHVWVDIQVYVKG
jgi:hypothetical protein